MKKPATSLYQAAIKVSNEYLGPAGERFLRRQISTHLGIEPEKLAKKDLKALVDWVRLTFALLTDDTEQVNDFAERLLRLPAANSRDMGARNGETS